MNKFKGTANHLAVISGVKLIAFLIVVIVAIYGDVAFLQIVGSSFPSGLLSGLAYLGAFTTTGSVIGLYIGKQRWFRPGGQLLWAWVFTGVEFGVLVLNCLLAFAIYRHSVDSYLMLWLNYCPITPFVSAAGWILITMLDPEQKQYHEDMEMEDDMKSAERAHAIAAHNARMQLRTQMLEQQTAYLTQEVNSAPMQAGIREAAKRLAQQELKGLAGFPVVPALPEANIVDGTGHAVPEETVKKSDLQSAIFKSDPDTRVDMPGVTESVDRVAAYYERQLKELREKRPLETAPLTTDQDSQTGTNGKH